MHGMECRPLARSILTLALGLVVLAGCSLSSPKPLPETAASEHFADHKSDLEYASGSAAQRLDLHVPAGAEPSPVVVLLHGGFWEGGDKSDFGLSTVSALTKAGYAVALVNFRLMADAPWPAAVQDAKAAVRFLRANAATYNLDPDRIAVLGSSSGGYLAAALALTGGLRTIFDDPELGNAEISARVQAAVLWSAPVDFASLDAQLAAADCPSTSQFHGLPTSAESRWLDSEVAANGDPVQQSNLLRYIPEGATLPPFQLVHGAKDCTVPAAQSRSLHDAVRQAQGQSTLQLVRTRKHHDARFARAYLDAAITFLNTAMV
jgi:acetyl esterase/lipase